MSKCSFWVAAVLVGTLGLGCATQPQERKLAADETVRTTTGYKVVGNGLGNATVRQTEVAEIVKNTTPVAAVPVAPKEPSPTAPAAAVNAPAPVSFSYPVGHAGVAASQAKRLFPVAQWLKENPDKKVTIDGYADSPGNAEFNQRLSTNRANNLRKELIKLGVKADQVAAVGHGENPGVDRKATITP